MIYTVCDGLGVAALPLKASLVDPSALATAPAAGPGAFHRGVRQWVESVHGGRRSQRIDPDFETSLATARQCCLDRTAKPTRLAGEVACPVLGPRLGPAGGFAAALAGGAGLVLAIAPTLWPGFEVPAPLVWGWGAFVASAAALWAVLLWSPLAAIRRWLAHAPRPTTIGAAGRRVWRPFGATPPLPGGLLIDYVIHADTDAAKLLAGMTLTGPSAGLAAFLAGVAAVVDSGRKPVVPPWQRLLSRELEGGGCRWVASACLDADGRLHSVGEIPDKLQKILALHRPPPGSDGPATDTDSATRAVWSSDDATVVRAAWARLTGDPMRRYPSPVDGCQVWHGDNGRLEFIFADSVDALAGLLYPWHRRSLVARLAALVVTPVLFLQLPQLANPSMSVECVTPSDMVSGQALQPTSFAGVVHLSLAASEVANCRLSVAATGYPGPAALTMLADLEASFALPPGGSQSAITPAREYRRTVDAGADVAFVVLPVRQRAGTWLAVELRNRAGRVAHTTVFVHPAGVPAGPSAPAAGDAAMTGDTP